MRKLDIKELQRLSTQEFKSADKFPLVVLLDDVRSQHNIGSVFRTCDAFRVQEIALCGITATPPNREIQKTALGATESVDWKYFNSAEEACQYYKNEGFTLISVEQAEGSILLQNFESKTIEKMVLIFGNEVKGVNQNIINISDYCIEIPQFGTKHSFNISVTAGIVLWDIYKSKAF